MLRLRAYLSISSTFVEQTALVDVPVLLAASGGGDHRHALVLEHTPGYSVFPSTNLTDWGLCH